MDRIKNNKHVSGFVQFLKERGVIGLAIGLVLGTAAAALVTSLINNVVMPPIGLLLGSADGLRGLTLTLGKTVDGTPAVMYYGQFISDLINFVIIALVVYLVVKAFKFDKDVK